MSEPGGEKTHPTKTSRTTSGGSSSVLEHPTANENGETESDDRGRCRDCQPADGNAVTMKQTQGEQLEVCPGLLARDAHPMCAAAAHPCQEPAGDGAAGEDGLVARGNSGDKPREETLSLVQGESGCLGGKIQPPSDARLGKKKHRRRPSKKKRRWKPYFKLSWEEKKALDERETERASRMRAEMFAKGLPVAPYNTTQFLMEEHDREEPDLNTELVGRRITEDTASEEDYFEPDEEEDGSGGGSDGMGRPGNAGGEFLQRDFSETYEKYHVESLQNMTKAELVREYLELEKCMSRLEEENNRLRCIGRCPDISAGSPVAPQLPDASRLRELEVELERLRAQNSELRLQNQLYTERGQTMSNVGTSYGQMQREIE